MKRRPYAEEPARRPLIALSVMASIAMITGTFSYTYPETMGPIRREMILVHDVSGDLMIVAGFVYVWVHLKRTWRLKKFKTSRWTGYASVAAFLLVSGTGVWGQVLTLEGGTTTYLLHIVGALLLIGLACFHGGYGMIRRLR